MYKFVFRIKIRKYYLILNMLLFALLLGSASFAATISGTITWKGKVPKMKRVKMDKDAICVKRWADKPIPRRETLVINEIKGLANTFVRIKSGLSKKDYPVPQVPLMIDQNGCKYVPHVFGIIKNQKFIFINSDGTRHNVHALPHKNRQFNLSMSKTQKESKPKKFRKIEGFFKIKCDIHPWMKSWASILDHPFFSVSGEDGTFKIENLPAGTYEVETWHESLKSQVVEVIIGENDTKTVNFVYDKKMRQIKK